MPRFSILRFLCPLMILALVSSCSSSSPTGPSGPSGPSSGSGTFTASIDGSSFSSAKAAAFATGGNVAPGGVVIEGTQITSTTNTSSVVLTLGFITGTGTYPLGVNEITTAGGIGATESNTSSGIKSWTTDLNGAAGTVTITKLSSTEIAGAFSFTAPRDLGQSGSDTTVTNGKFDVPMTGFVLGTEPVDLFKATSLDGAAFNGATIGFQGSSSTSFGLSGSNEKSVNGGLSSTTITIVSSGPVTAGTSYPIETLRAGAILSIQVNIGSSAFFGDLPGDTGTVTITSTSGGRMKGTFSANFAAGLTIVGGSFDVKAQ
jgi:hypothetical protein